MKISPKQYAQALYEAIKDGDKKQAEKAIKKFAKILHTNNDVSKISAIIGFFSEMWNKKEGIIEAEITSAREISHETMQLLNDYLAKKTKSEKIVVKNKIDKNILGGVVIKYNDKVIDGSLKTVVRDLKNKIIK